MRPNHNDPACSSSKLKPHSSGPQVTSQPDKQMSKNVLFLEQSHITFDTPTSKISVFFDECNREIISVTSDTDTKTKVVFQATDRNDKVHFTLPVERKIQSIKLNPSRSILAYHVEQSNVEFINVRQRDDVGRSVMFELEGKRYIQGSRTKNSKLIGFLWTGLTDLVMITDISIEYYHVEPQKRRLKHSKSFPSSTNWFVYQPLPLVPSFELCEACPDSILMVSTGSIGNSIQPYMFCRNQIIKLQRFEVDGNWRSNDKLELFERSVTMAYIYGKIRLLVLQHRSMNAKSKGAQILIYTVDCETGITGQTHTLDLDFTGRFAINVLDNLIIAHDQPSKSSFIFDIMIESTEKSDCPKHFVSLIDKQPIRPLCLKDVNVEIEMYSLNWVFFQPNFIIDAKMGLLTTLHLNLRAVQESIQDDLMLLNFLAHRKRSEQLILNKCKELVANSYEISTTGIQSQGSPLSDVSSVFDLLSKLVTSAPELTRSSNDKVMVSRSDTATYVASMNQEEVHREVFHQFESSGKKGPAHVHFVSSTLLEFIFYVRRQDKNVDFCVYEQLFRCLVRGRRFYQLVQMIRSEIFTDSKQLACLLLSSRNQYKPAGQLGLDMLHRLDCLTDLIESLNLSPNPNMLHTSETTSLLSVALNRSMEVDAS